MDRAAALPNVASSRETEAHLIIHQRESNSATRARTHCAFTTPLMTRRRTSCDGFAAVWQCWRLASRPRVHHVKAFTGTVFACLLALVKKTHTHVALSEGFGEQGGVVTHPTSFREALSVVVWFLEHAAVAVLGLIMMIVGIGLSLTIIMLPVGIIIGLLGVAVFVGGMFCRIEA